MRYSPPLRRPIFNARLIKRAGTPAAANNFLKSMRSLFAWAVRNGHVKHDPTHNVERVKYKTDGFPVWTIDEVAAYCAYHPIGTKARLTLELLLLTGLRRSDIVRLGRQHVRDNVLTTRTVKTNAEVSIRLPQELLHLIAIFTDRRIAFFWSPSVARRLPWRVSGIGFELGAEKRVSRKTRMVCASSRRPWPRKAAQRRIS